MPKSTENTVFVRLIPPPAKVMRHELEELFSQMGPIKKSSWIYRDAMVSSKKKKLDDNDPQLEGGSIGMGEDASSSKGYGFVKYISSQDALAATRELNDSSIQMNGKSIKLKVELASETGTVGTATARGNSMSKSKQIRQGDIVDSNDEDDNDQELTPYKSKANAALNKAPSQYDDSSTISLVSKMKSSSRIIVRNLSFYANERHVRNAMEAEFGRVIDVHVPYVKDKLHVGFCFVTFESVDGARKAVASKHARIRNRAVTMEWCMPKGVHQQQKRESHSSRKGRLTVHVEDDENTDLLGKGIDSKDDSGVDEAEEEGGNSGRGADKDDEDDDDIDSEDDDSAGDEELSDGSTWSASKQLNGVKGMGDQVDTKRALFLRNLPFDTTRHDIFQMFSNFGYIEGIYLVRDKETHVFKGTAFVSYSKAESAQKALERFSRTLEASSASSHPPTSFVSQREANSQLTASGGLAGTDHSLTFRGRQLMVDLAVDKETAATFDRKFRKTASVDRRNMYLQAESRVESSSSAESVSAGKLAGYGTWDDLPFQDQKRRQNALKDKTTKLQSPLFFINPKRLSFRNLAKHVDEAALRELCVCATKRGLEKGLVAATDQIAHWRAPGDLSTREILAKLQKLEADQESVIPAFWNDDRTEEAKDGKVKDRGVKEYIPSVFIDRDFGKGAKKSDAPSRGFGFVEFRHHVHALSCLRELNNNPEYSKDFAAGGAMADALKSQRGRRNAVIKKTGRPGNGYVGDDGRILIPRLIVDFTVENKAKARKQAEHRMQQQFNQAKQSSEKRKKLETEEGKPRKKRSRGAIQRERKRKMRESEDTSTKGGASSVSPTPAQARKPLATAITERKTTPGYKTVERPKKKRMNIDLEGHRATIAEGRDSSLNAQEKTEKKRWFE